jgi:hypothetical protein
VQRCITLTIVDTAGGWSDACTGAMAAADLCLIPTRPSPADIEAAAPTLTANRGLTLHELKRLIPTRPSPADIEAAAPTLTANRGLTLHELKRYDDALASFDDALKVQPNHAEALFNRGLTAGLAAEMAMSSGLAFPLASRSRIQRNASSTSC